MLFISACVPLQPQNTPYKKENTDRLNILVQLNDLNERAFAYHHYCLKKDEPINETFLDNLETTSNLLFDECKTVLKWKPEYIVSQVVKRREKIQEQLRSHYRSKGCRSSEAMAAYNHYQSFSRLGEADIEALTTPR